MVPITTNKMSYQITGGSVSHLTSVNSLNPKGSTYKNPKRKTHFTIVKVLYLLISGFTRTKYKAQEIELISIIKSPVIVSEPNENDLLNNKSNNAPAIPNVIPINLLTETLSLRTAAAINKTTIGFEIIMMDALIGVVILNPFKNKSWLHATPNTANNAKRGKSFLSIFSLMKRELTNQNKINAPPTRMSTNAKGCTCVGITSLAME